MRLLNTRLRTCVVPSRSVPLAVLSLAALLIGCGSEPSPMADQDSAESATSVDGDRYLLADEPASATDVIAVREQAEDGDPVVIVGRIGGSQNPWIDGRAAFSIVDESLQACSDIPGDACPEPWDYCCETPKLAGATALVKVVDESGELVRVDAKKLLPVQELSTIVAEGTAQRDDAGNLTVLADKIYVRKR